MFGEIDVLSGTYRGSGGGRDGDMPGLERVGEVWVIERNLRKTIFLHVCYSLLVHVCICSANYVQLSWNVSILLSCHD